MSEQESNPATGGENEGPFSAGEMFEEVYSELRQLAAAKMARERQGQTLQATALVHEAYLRLDNAEDAKPKWKNKRHFFGAAAEAMRRILIENARKKQSQKRGGEFERAEFEESRIVALVPDDELLAVDEALEKLSEADPDSAELVKLRYFVGLTGDEAAEAMEISPRTGARLWAYARTFLHHEIKGDQGGAA